MAQGSQVFKDGNRHDDRSADPRVKQGLPRTTSYRNLRLCAIWAVAVAVACGFVIHPNRYLQFPGGCAAAVSGFSFPTERASSRFSRRCVAIGPRFGFFGKSRNTMTMEKRSWVEPRSLFRQHLQEA